MYYTAMVQPKTPPISIRLSPQLVADLEAHMTETGRSRNLAISQLLGLGLQAFADTPKYAVRAGPAPVQAALDEVRIVQKPIAVPKQPERYSSFGPQRARFGERLKTPKGGK